jgi:hypothetical protein
MPPSEIRRKKVKVKQKVFKEKPKSTYKKNGKAGTGLYCESCGAKLRQIEFVNCAKCGSPEIQSGDQV